MHWYELKHTNENKWLNPIKKMNNKMLQEDFFFKKSWIRWDKHLAQKPKRNTWKQMLALMVGQRAIQKLQNCFWKDKRPTESWKKLGEKSLLRDETAEKGTFLNYLSAFWSKLLWDASTKILVLNREQYKT